MLNRIKKFFKKPKSLKMVKAELAYELALGQERANMRRLEKQIMLNAHQLLPYLVEAGLSYAEALKRVEEVEGQCLNEYSKRGLLNYERYRTGRSLDDIMGDD